MRRFALWTALAVVGSSCTSRTPESSDGGGKSQEAPAEASTARTTVSLVDTARAIVGELEALEIERDVTCWTSFRQLDNFISTKSYSEFATLTKIMAVKALVRGVWARASDRPGATVSVEDLEAVYSVEADLPEARKAELQKFADDLGMQQFRDYRTTSEHWRILLSVVQDELGRARADLEPLEPEALERLAVATTKLALALLTESGDVATEARTPFIEAEHVRTALGNLRTRFGLQGDPKPAKSDSTRARTERIALTKANIEAKVAALRSYNDASAELPHELQKLSSIPLEEEAVALMLRELESMTRFFAKGYEPMRADNYLADGNFAPAKLQTKPYIDAAHVENVTHQVFPYSMLANGDVRLRFEPRPGQVSDRDLEGQDVTLLDHHMNAVRDTALHWVVMERVFEEEGYAMDPFAAEYLSELVSIVATFYLRRAQTLARARGAETITAELMAAVRDPGYVMVAPGVPEHVQWDEEQKAAKKALLAGYAEPMFVDVTAKMGLPTALPERPGMVPGSEAFDIQTVMGSGIAVGRLDDDEYPDLFVAGEGLGRLYLNRDGKRFEDVSAAWGIPEDLSDSHGSLMVDFDADGDLDLLVVRSVKPSLLLKNVGGRFEDVAREVGLKTSRGAHVATAFDYDGDEDLDLYIGYYGSRDCNDGACQGRNLPSLDGRNGTPNQLFRNDDGQFTEVGAKAGVDDVGWTLAVSSFDYDADGDFDLYLANDFGPNPLLRNDGSGHFTDVAVELGAADRGSGMNVSFADVDGNGAFDVFVSNIDMFSKNIKIVFPSDASVVELDDDILKSFQYLSGNKLYFNVEEGERRRFDAREGVWFEPGDRGWGWAGVFFDYEHDGDEDLYLANGWIPGSPAADQANQLFVRDEQTFYQVDRDEEPAAFRGNSRSVVATDFDLDGDLDLVANNFRQAPRVLRNEQGGGNHWLGVRLRGKAPNLAAVGAVLELKVAGRVQRRVVTCGNGYLGQDDEVAIFGLGKHERGTLEVEWPDGTRTKHENLAGDRRHEISR